MRVFFFLLTLAGLAGAFAYPAYVDFFSGEEIGTFRVIERDGPGMAPNVYLDPDDAPVGVILRLENLDQPGLRGDAVQETVLALEISRGEVVVRKADVTFLHHFTNPDAADAGPRPARQEKLAFRIDPVSKGDHAFSIGRTPREDVPLQSVDLVLRRKLLVADERVAPAGFILLVLGVVGLIVIRRRKRALIAPRPGRSIDKWGR